MQCSSIHRQPHSHSSLKKNFKKTEILKISYCWSPPHLKKGGGEKKIKKERERKTEICRNIENQLPKDMVATDTISHCSVVGGGVKLTLYFLLLLFYTVT